MGIEDSGCGPDLELAIPPADRGARPIDLKDAHEKITRWDVESGRGVRRASRRMSRSVSMVVGIERMGLVGLEMAAVNTENLGWW